MTCAIDLDDNIIIIIHTYKYLQRELNPALGNCILFYVGMSIFYVELDNYLLLDDKDIKD